MVKPLVLVIVGPTASGKSAVAVKLAKKFDGEIISADSRQVYRGLDIGSGKITAREMAGVRHHLLDIASPRLRQGFGGQVLPFSVAQFQKLANKKIAEILRRGKLPIICGGTGFYIQAVVDGLALPPVPPNPKLRARLEKKTPAELFTILQALDSARAEHIDARNPHRLIRAIEIGLGFAEKHFGLSFPAPSYEFLQIGLNPPPEILRQKIRRRLAARVRQGLIEEVARLHREGVSWRRLEAFGLEYGHIARLLRKNWRDFRVASEPASRRVKREEIAPVLKSLETAIWHYAKRQLTWFKRDRRIIWVGGVAEAAALVKREQKNRRREQGGNDAIQTKRFNHPKLESGKIERKKKSGERGEENQSEGRRPAVKQVNRRQDKNRQIKN